MLDPVKVEAAEASIDRFIEQRSRQRDRDNALEEMWKASERKHLEKRRAEHRDLWIDYHRGQAARLRNTLDALVSKHEERVRELQANEVRETT